MSRKWPVEIVSDEAVAAAAVISRHRGRKTLTVIVKATFSPAHGGPMLRGVPREIAREDRTYDGSPARSLESASDLAPFLPRCDVLFRGFAYAQKGQAAPAGAARLAVFRDARPLLDKTIHVFAQPPASRADARQALPRAVQPARGSGPEQVFSRMPIVYERAFGGPDVEANPAGVPTPNLVDPVDPRRPAGFGPIAPRWPARQRLFGARRPDPESLPEDLDWGYFQAAPPDQQIPYLRGGEWLVLDALHPALPRLQTQVPMVRGAARVLSRPPGSRGLSGVIEAPIELVADTLWIDGEALQCSITWRGQVPFPAGADALPPTVLLAALESADRPAPWAKLAAQGTAVLAMQPEEAPRSLKHPTMTLSVQQQGTIASAAPTPFAAAPPSRPAAAPRTDATPWGPPSSRSVPVASAAPGTSTVLTPPVTPAPGTSTVLTPPIALAPSLPFVPADKAPPEPPEEPAAVEPPPMVGPIQPLSAGAPEAPSPPPAGATPALPPRLGRASLGPAEVASFLQSFELPPPPSRG